MSSDSKLPPTRDLESDSSEERFRQDRRRFFVGALASAPVIVSIMARPAWAQQYAEPGRTYTRPSAFTCHSALNAGYTEDYLEGKYGPQFFNEPDNKCPRTPKPTK